MRKMPGSPTRRRFIRGAAAGVSAGGWEALAQKPAGIRGFDHVALPLQNTDAMLRFYRDLGFDVDEGKDFCLVYVGDQMISFHRPALWQSARFTLRASAAKPPCGDLCFVWDGSPASLRAMLDRAQAKIVEGPVPRQGGRKKTGSSVYVRDPDGNLLEFMIYS